MVDSSFLLDSIGPICDELTVRLENVSKSVKSESYGNTEDCSGHCPLQDRSECFFNDEGEEVGSLVQRTDLKQDERRQFSFILTLHQMENEKYAGLRVSIGDNGYNVFGGPGTRISRLPVETVAISTESRSRDYILKPENYDTIGNVCDWIWFIASEKHQVPLSLRVSDSCPFVYDINASSISFRPARKVPDNQCFGKKALTIHIETFFLGTTIMNQFDRFIADVVDSDAQICLPDLTMMRYPIWTTWARYKTKINQDLLIDFATQIRDNGMLPISQLEIDDMYTPNHGDLVFDAQSFPNPSKMIIDLKRILNGCRVTSWIHPFMNPDSEAYREAIAKDYLIRHVDDEGKLKVAEVQWWNGKGAMIDPGNEDACRWFIKRLADGLASHGIDAFKFDAGEVDFLPKNYRLASKTPAHPMEMTTAYVRNVVKAAENAIPNLTPGMSECRTAHRNQADASFVRIHDLDSRWGFDNGLQSLIPKAIQIGLSGYPFVIPDMVGGNAYTTEYPTKELFIRWTQATILMPSVQFSIVPWTYDKKTVEIVRNAIKIRETLWESHFLPAIGETKAAETRLRPILRPMNWSDNFFGATERLNDQFYIGDDLIVCPVVIKGAKTRKFCLPNDEWKDSLTGKIWEGRCSGEVPVALGDLLYFTRYHK